MRMKGKVGIVTAAASGMGRAGAVRFAREGAAVAVVDRDEAGVAATVAQIVNSGGRAKGIVADLGEDDAARQIVKEAANAFGGLDFVWNHLGHPGPASVDGVERPRPIRHLSATAWLVRDTPNEGAVPCRRLRPLVSIWPRLFSKCTPRQQMEARS